MEFHLTLRHRYALGLLLAVTLVGPAATTTLRAAPSNNWPALGGPEFEVLSVNSMGEGIWASPAIANGRIYIRTLDHLWAIEQME